MGDPPPQPYYRTIRCFEACIPPKIPLRCYSDASKIAKRYRSSERIPTRRSSYSITLSAFSYKPDSTPVIQATVAEWLDRHSKYLRLGVWIPAKRNC